MKIPVSNPRSHHPKQHDSFSIRPRLVRLTPSNDLWMIVLSIHLLAILAVYLTSLLFIWQLLLTVTVFLSLAYTYLQKIMHPVFRLQHYQDGWYMLVEKVPVATFENALSQWCRQRSFWQQGDAYRIVSWSYRSVLVVVVCVEDKRGRQRYIPIFHDCCQRGEFCWLRVVVKYLL